MSDSPDSPPPVEQTEPVAPVAPAGNDTTGLPRHIAAALACFLSIVGGIVFLALEKKDQFVRFYAMQSLILGGAGFAISIALKIVEWILTFIPFVGGFLAILFALAGMVVGLVFLAVWIVTIVKALSNKEWEIPYLGKIAREQLTKIKPGLF